MRFMLSALLMQLVVGVTTAQDTVTLATGSLKVEPSRKITLQAREKGISLQDFLMKWTEATGRRFSFQESNLRGKGKIQITGDITVRQEQADELFRSILVTHQFAMIPTGPKEANLWTIEPLDSSRIIKQQAAYVEVSELSAMKTDAGRVIMTTIPLRHVEVTQVRGAVQQILNNRNFEFAQEVASANSLVVVGFAPTVNALYNVLRAMDVPAAAATLSLEKIQLRYASAREIVPVIRDLLAPRSAGKIPNQRTPGCAVPAPRFVADARSNAVIVHALDAQIKQVKRLVATLDVKAENK